MKLVNFECYSPKQTKPLFEILVFTILHYRGPGGEG